MLWLSTKYIITIVTKIVNYIAPHALNKHTFGNLLELCGSEYSGLLVYNNVRWLICGNVLYRFVELLEEVKFFLAEKKSNISRVERTYVVERFAFLC